MPFSCFLELDLILGDTHSEIAGNSQPNPQHGKMFYHSHSITKIILNFKNKELNWKMCLVFLDHETGIMHRLQNTILEHSAVLVDVMRLAAELDW